MKALIAAVITAVALNAAPAHAAPPDLFYPAIALHVVDYGQTLSIVGTCHHGGYYEHNNILGNCPNRGSVNEYFATTLALEIVLHEVLPERYKPYASLVWVSIGTASVAHNAAIGVGFRF